MSGDRSFDPALTLMVDMSYRLDDPPVLTTDALRSYVDAALIACGGAVEHTVSKAETSFVERQNLTTRMGMRRFTRKTNGFSKRFEYHFAHIALHTTYYNFCRPHLSLDGQTPAMPSGLSGEVRSLGWILGLINARAPKPQRPSRYRRVA